MTIVDRIKELCSTKSTNMASLERELNLSKGSISKWVKSSPNSDGLQKVADYFHVSVDYLLGREEHKLALSENERFLLATYSKLNNLGKHEAIKRVSELTEIPKYFNYTQEYEFETIAAHADDLTEEENNTNLTMIKAFMVKRRQQDK